MSERGLTANERHHISDLLRGALAEANRVSGAGGVWVTDLRRVFEAIDAIIESRPQPVSRGVRERMDRRNEAYAYARLLVRLRAHRDAVKAGEFEAPDAAALVGLETAIGVIESALRDPLEPLALLPWQRGLFIAVENEFGLARMGLEPPVAPEPEPEPTPPTTSPGWAAHPYSTGPHDRVSLLADAVAEIADQPSTSAEIARRIINRHLSDESREEFGYLAADGTISHGTREVATAARRGGYTLGTSPIIFGLRRRVVTNEAPGPWEIIP